MAVQLVTSHIAPDGRVHTLAKDIRLNSVPDGWLSGEAARDLLAGRLTWVIEWARYRQSRAQGSDAELLDSVAAALETQLRTMAGGGATGWLERERHHRR